MYFLDGDDTLATLINRQQPYISFITELELLSFKSLTDADRRIIQGFLSECIIVDVNVEIKKFVIDIRSHYSVKLPDAIVAASALYLNLPLFTANSDFKKLKEIDIIFYEK